MINRIFLLTVIFLAGCGFAFDEAQWLSPNFQRDPEDRPERILEPIRWKRLSYQDFPLLLKNNNCSLLYITTPSCLDCYYVEKEIFKDIDNADLIRANFDTYRVTSDHEDFERFVYMWEPPIRDVPIVAVINRGKIYLWQPRGEIQDLQNMIEISSEECGEY